MYLYKPEQSTQQLIIWFWSDKLSGITSPYKSKLVLFGRLI